jgi:hypothetical protein
MKMAMAIFGYALGLYFLWAIFVPRIRLHWGNARVWIFLPNFAKSKASYRAPKMGTLSCFGFSLFITTLTSIFIVSESAIPSVVPFLFVGFIFGLVGRIKDIGGGGGWRKY